MAATEIPAVEDMAERAVKAVRECVKHLEKGLGYDAHAAELAYVISRARALERTAGELARVLSAVDPVPEP